MKICTQCKINKPRSDFHKHKKGVNPCCKPCRSISMKAYRKTEGYTKVCLAYRSTKRAQTFKREYGVDIGIKYMYLSQQGNSCQICKTYLTTKTANLDHCHFSGRLRGVLCRACNVGLGFFRDNIEVLKESIKYLENNLPTDSGNEIESALARSAFRTSLK